MPDIFRPFHYDSFVKPMPPDAIQSTLQQALQLHQSGRLAEAEPIYRSILAQNPNQPDAVHLLGVLFWQTSRVREALPLLRQARLLQPDSADVRGNLLNFLVQAGEQFRRQGKAADALAAFKEAAELDPSRPEIHTLLGVAYAALGEKQNATRCFEKSISLKPDYADAHNNLGLCLEGAAAIEQFQTAIRLRPNFAGAYNNLANALKDADQLDPAIDAFRKAIDLKPDYAQAMVGLAVRSNHAGAWKRRSIFIGERWPITPKRPMWSKPRLGSRSKISEGSPTPSLRFAGDQDQS